MRIGFVGDICLNGRYIELAERGSSPFQYISNLYNFDLLVGNLECISSGSGEDSKLPGKLQTTSDALNLLNEIHVDLVTLANNHIFDQGIEGFRKTRISLEHHSINFIGAWENNEMTNNKYFYQNEGISVLLFNYLHEDTKPAASDTPPFQVSLYDKERIINDLKDHQNDTDFRILLFHWGGRFEGGIFPDRYQWRDAKDFISNGADLIIGHHSHTFQPFETINDKYVFYSLGNFCSDTVYKGGRRHKLRSNSAIVGIDLQKESLQQFLIPITNENYYLKQAPDFNAKINQRNFALQLIKLLPFHLIYTVFHNIIEPIHFYFFGYNRRFLKKLSEISLSKFKLFIIRFLR